MRRNRQTATGLIYLMFQPADTAQLLLKQDKGGEKKDSKLLLLAL